MIIDGVKIYADPITFERDELKEIVAESKKKVGPELKEIHVTATADGGYDVEYKSEGVKFERIRRITGYLVGTLDRWNNAKRAEESERVKHEVEG